MFVSNFLSSCVAYILFFLKLNNIYNHRKTCKHCKCAMSKHVTRTLTDNRISCQPKTFELCFKTRTKPNSIKLSQNNTTETISNYSWTPPNLNNYQVVNKLFLF